MTEYVYIATRDGLTKVGMAVKPARRVRQQRAEMFWRSVPCEGAAAVEYASCQAMRRRIVPGKREWFYVRPEVALRVVLRAMRRSTQFIPLPDAMLRGGHSIPSVAEAIGVSKSLIYQRARDEWAPRIAEGGGK